MPVDLRNRFNPASDPFSAHRFHVASVGSSFLPRPESPEAGFSFVTMPEHLIEEVDYSEGIFTYPRSYPGRGSFSNVTFGKGIFRGDTAFAKWIRQTSEGSNYRTDLDVYHYHRTDVTDLVDYRSIRPRRIYKLRFCYPVRYRPGTDFDAVSNDISVQELELKVEHMIVYDTDSGGEVRVF